MSEFPETRDPNEKRTRIGTAYHCPDTDQYILMADDDPQIEIDRLTARAEAAENVINAAHAVLARQVAEPHTSRGDTNAMVEAITILETVTLKGGEE